MTITDIMGNRISAKMIEHSVDLRGNELISVETYAPKFLDAEVEKHRNLSSNSSSDRAIPVRRMLKEKPFIPNDIRKNQKGMQGDTQVDEATKMEYEVLLTSLYRRTKQVSLVLDELNIHKQHINRLLLPFSMQRKILTGTMESWKYFFDLRLHRDADPAIYQLAVAINDEIDNSIPEVIDYNQWHLPYISHDEKKELPYELLPKLSAARCARVSYNNFDGNKPTIQQDLDLFEKLVGNNPKHLSPLDHQGKPCVVNNALGVTHLMRDGRVGSGNLIGFVQFRHVYLQGLGE